MNTVNDQITSPLSFQRNGALPPITPDPSDIKQVCTILSVIVDSHIFIHFGIVIVYIIQI